MGTPGLRREECKSLGVCHLRSLDAYRAGLLQADARKSGRQEDNMPSRLVQLGANTRRTSPLAERPPHTEPSGCASPSATRLAS